MNTDPAPLHENENENVQIFEKSLFAKFAFGNQIPSSYPDLEPIGRKIVRSCDSVPSTVRTLGSLLRFKLQVADWKTVHWKLATSRSIKCFFLTDFFLFSFN